MGLGISKCCAKRALPPVYEIELRWNGDFSPKVDDFVGAFLRSRRLCGAFNTFATKSKQADDSSRLVNLLLNDFDEIASKIENSIDVPRFYLKVLLDLGECRGLTESELMKLDMLHHVCRLDLHATGILRTPSMGACLSLEYLDLSECPDITDLSALGACFMLRSLFLRSTGVVNLSSIQNLARLEELDLSDTPVKNIVPLGGLMMLQKLLLSRTRVVDVLPLQKCARLSTLFMDNLREPVTGMASITALKETLEVLHLNHNRSLIDLRALSECENLYELHISLTNVADLSFLGTSCSLLRELNLSGCLRLQRLDELSGCKATLERLSLDRTSIVDLAPLKDFSQLSLLDLYQTRVHDITPLASCENLRVLNLAHTAVEDVAALGACQKLRVLNLESTRVKDVSSLTACSDLTTLLLNGSTVEDVSLLQGVAVLNVGAYFNEETEMTPVSPLIDNCAAETDR